MKAQAMPNWLIKRAELTPSRTAVIFQQESRTFAELHEASLRTAKQLGFLGIQSGDHVALLLQNRIETVVLIHALTYIGAVAVMLNTRLTPHELAWQIEDANVKYLIYDSHNQDKAASLPQSSKRNWQGSLCDEVFALPEKEIPIRKEIDLDEIHTIIYTSGTTGYPKGVMLSYGNHWWSAIGSSLNLGLDADDCWLAALPFFHVSGLSILMRSVIYGISVLIHDRFDPAEVNQAILQGEVTHISVVSNMLARMLSELKGPSYPKRFRCMLAGGGPVPLHLLEECKSRGIPVYQTYGMTETASQIVTLGPEYMLSKLGSAGKPLFPAELRIEKDGKVLAAGEVGEIVVKGPSITKGYYLREEATRQAIQNDWFYTGDLGYVDEDGFLYVLDRRSDLIISGGENIYPAEIEHVLTSFPAIEDAGVIGIPHENWGQVPIAYVKIREGFTLNVDEILQYCRERLARYKVPHALHLIDEIPRNAANKILRRKLREIFLPSRNES